MRTKAKGRRKTQTRKKGRKVMDEEPKAVAVAETVPEVPEVIPTEPAAVVEDQPAYQIPDYLYDSQGGKYQVTHINEAEVFVSPGLGLQRRLDRASLEQKGYVLYHGPDFTTGKTYGFETVFSVNPPAEPPAVELPAETINEEEL